MLYTKIGDAKSPMPFRYEKDLVDEIDIVHGECSLAIMFWYTSDSLVVGTSVSGLFQLMDLFNV
jgi:hypothetical protein